jgi:hypothetical protein
VRDLHAVIDRLLGHQAKEMGIIPLTQV